MADFAPAFSSKDCAPGRAVPWPIVAATVTAIFLLAITYRSALPPLVAAFTLSVTYLIACSAAKEWVNALVQLPLGAGVLLYMFALGFRFDQNWALSPLLLTGLGLFLCGEVGFQAVRPRPAGSGAVPSLIMMSACIMICGCYTYDAKFVPVFAPVYFLFLLLTFARHAQEQRLRVGSGGQALPWRWALMASLALCAGFAFYLTLWFNRDAITNTFTSFMFQMEHRSEVGLPAEPMLQSTTGLSQSRKRLLRISGPLREPYLRAAAFDSYNVDGRWRLQMGLRSMELVAMPDLNPNAEGPRFHVEPLAEDMGIIYAPLSAQGIVMDEAVQLERAQLPLSGPLKRVSPGLTSSGYTVVQSTAPDQQGLFCLPRMDRLRDIPQSARLHTMSFFQVPSELIRMISGDVTAGKETAREKILAIQNYLAMNHRYSLEISIPRGAEPVEAFLTGKKDGFCEFFASSAVLLLRAAGVPSRYVQGYYAHEKLPNGDTVVRARDAHAWCESWVDDVGWVVVEATPSDGLPTATDNPSMIERFGDWVTDTWEWLKVWFAERGWELVFYGALLLLMGVGFFRFVQDWLKRNRVRRRDDFAYADPGEGFRDFARRFENVLRRVVKECPRSNTWQEHLDWIAARDAAERGIDLERAKTFVREYNAARFADSAAAQSRSLKRLDELLTTLERN
jgi:transglutaminase-like putative cysteine protease